MGIFKKICRKILAFPTNIQMKKKKSKWKNASWIDYKEPLMVFSETLLSGQLGKIEIGRKNCIRGIMEIQRPNGRIYVGDNCYIGENTRIWAAEEIKIGSNVMIAHNCNIFDNDTHPIDYLERRQDSENIIWGGGRKNYSSLKSSPVSIGDDAWICAGVTIVKGVSIGKRSIIAAGSVVTKSIPDNVVAAGNPAKVVKQLSIDFTSMENKG